jgi:hypothetical protein
MGRILLAWIFLIWRLLLRDYISFSLFLRDDVLVFFFFLLTIERVVNDVSLVLSGLLKIYESTIFVVAQIREHSARAVSEKMGRIDHQ